MFSPSEQELLEKAFKKIEKYLVNEEIVLVHNDLHFDNIFYHDHQLKIIDSERSTIAPKDYELAILYRMICEPWKFASEDIEKFTDYKDYSNIKSYLEKYYPEIVSVPYLQEYLTIYDLVYNLKHLIKYSEIKKLKDNVLLFAKIIALKDELTFERLTTTN